MPATATKRKLSDAEKRKATLANLISDNAKQAWTEFGSGVNDVLGRGTIAGLLGAPGDIANLGENGLRALIGKPSVTAWGGQEHIGQKMQDYGLVSDVRRPKTELLASLISPAQLATATLSAPKYASAMLRGLDNLDAPNSMRNWAQRGAIDIKGLGSNNLPMSRDIGKEIANKSGTNLVNYQSLPGQKFPIRIGSATQTKVWSKDELDDAVVAGVKHSMFDADFMYNWASPKTRKEYQDLFKNDVVGGYLKNPDMALKDIFQWDGKQLSIKPEIEKNNSMFIDNWFKNNKSVSPELLNDYASYRKKYAGKDIFQPQEAQGLLDHPINRLDSNGKPVGNLAKMVDNAPMRKPIDVWHGTDTEFATPQTPLFLGNRPTAEAYAKLRGMESGSDPVLMGGQADFKNSASEDDVKRIAEELGISVENNMAYTVLDPNISGKATSQKVIDALKAKGFDSAHIDDFSPDAHGDVIKSYVAFEPSQLSLKRQSLANLVAPQDEALRIAQQNASLPVEQPPSIFRDGEPRLSNGNVDWVARERFNIPELKKISSGGSDRDVYDLGNGSVLKVAKSARGLAQNDAHDWYLSNNGLLPEASETGANYIVTKKMLPPDAETKNLVNGLKQFSSRDWQNHSSALQDYLGKHDLTDAMNYDVMHGDFSAVRNWGVNPETGRPIHLDEGTFNNNILDEYRGTTNMSNPEFRAVHAKSKQAKKKYGDKDKATMYSLLAPLGIGGYLYGQDKQDVKLTNLQSALLVLIWVMYGGDVFTVFIALGNDSFDGVYRY